jgi:uncharacterized protein
MLQVNKLLTEMVKNIVDDEDSVQITQTDADKGFLLEVKVGKDDVGKVIGKQGRIAAALRTVTKAAAAKRGHRVMVNVFNKPLGEE